MQKLIEYSSNTVDSVEEEKAINVGKCRNVEKITEMQRIFIERSPFRIRRTQNSVRNNIQKSLQLHQNNKENVKIN